MHPPCNGGYTLLCSVHSVCPPLCGGRNRNSQLQRRIHRVTEDILCFAVSAAMRWTQRNFHLQRRIHRVTEDILCFAVCPPLCRWTKSQLPFETQHPPCNGGYTLLRSMSAAMRWMQLAGPITAGHPPGTGGYTFLRSIQYVRLYAVDATSRPDCIGPSTGYRRIYFSSLCPTSHELFALAHFFCA